MKRSLPRGQGGAFQAEEMGSSMACLHLQVQGGATLSKGVFRAGHTSSNRESVVKAQVLAYSLAASGLWEEREVSRTSRMLGQVAQGAWWGPQPRNCVGTKWDRCPQKVLQV